MTEPLSLPISNPQASRSRLRLLRFAQSLCQDVPKPHWGSDLIRVRENWYYFIPMAIALLMMLKLLSNAIAHS